MGIRKPQQSERRQRMLRAAEQYYEALADTKGAVSESDKRRLKRRLDRLAEPFTDDPAFTAFLKMERRAAGLDDEASDDEALDDEAAK